MRPSQGLGDAASVEPPRSPSRETRFRVAAPVGPGKAKSSPGVACVRRQADWRGRRREPQESPPAAVMGVAQRSFLHKSRGMASCPARGGEGRTGGGRNEESAPTPARCIPGTVRVPRRHGGEPRGAGGGLARAAGPTSSPKAGRRGARRESARGAWEKEARSSSPPPCLAMKTTAPGGAWWPAEGAWLLRKAPRAWGAPIAACPLMHSRCLRLGTMVVVVGVISVGYFGHCGGPAAPVTPPT